MHLVDFHYKNIINTVVIEWSYFSIVQSALITINMCYDLSTRLYHDTQITAANYDKLTSQVRQQVPLECHVYPYVGFGSGSVGLSYDISSTVVAS